MRLRFQRIAAAAHPVAHVSHLSVRLHPEAFRPSCRRSRVWAKLEPSGAGTLLKFRHYGLPSAEAAQSHSHGWDHYLARLVIAGRGDDPGEDRGPEGM